MVSTPRTSLLSTQPSATGVPVGPTEPQSSPFGPNPPAQRQPSPSAACSSTGGWSSTTPETPSEPSGICRSQSPPRSKVSGSRPGSGRISTVCTLKISSRDSGHGTRRTVDGHCTDGETWRIGRTPSGWSLDSSRFVHGIGPSDLQPELTWTRYVRRPRERITLPLIGIWRRINSLPSRSLARWVLKMPFLDRVEVW